MSQHMSMPMFWDVFFADTLKISPAAMKNYIVLLGQMWINGGSMPNDDAILARATRCTPREWRGVRDEVLSLCELDEAGRWTQKRLRKEWAYIEDIVEKKRRAGAAGGKKKAENSSLVSNAPRENTFTEAQAINGQESNKINGHALADARMCQAFAVAPTPTPTPIERKNTLTSVTKNGAAHAPPPDTPPKKKPTRIPEDFDPSADSNQIGFDGGMTEKQIMDELDNFMDYWRAKPGTAAMKLDWEATWRTWLRRAVKDHAQKSQKAFFDGTGYATRGNRH
jgi:uncharacterized protein YdaU (DUF1376 family)